ncbi:uncharacterized protein LOC132639791 [Lycium barbarum]|uniref:uncharacterized protein LOC132639791 n=1 Tax=Lycium barbarum TaxID=112863 RepID=UPI00293EE1E2|nr:uncharacterized protein LOC132639791 [Lycium barbarum]
MEVLTKGITDYNNGQSATKKEEWQISKAKRNKKKKMAQKKNIVIFKAVAPTYSIKKYKRTTQNINKNECPERDKEKGDNETDNTIVDVRDAIQEDDNMEPEEEVQNEQEGQKENCSSTEERTAAQDGNNDIQDQQHQTDDSAEDVEDTGQLDTGDTNVQTEKEPNNKQQQQKKEDINNANDSSKEHQGNQQKETNRRKVDHLKDKGEQKQVKNPAVPKRPKG